VRLGIKGKQVLGVTVIVGLIVLLLSGLYLARIAQVRLDETAAQAEALAKAIYHRASEVVTGDVDPVRVLATDVGLRSLLVASLYSKDVTFAAIVDANGVAVAHADRSLEGRPLRPGAI